jgi:hypothetical protein
MTTMTKWLTITVMMGVAEPASAQVGLTTLSAQTCDSLSSATDSSSSLMLPDSTWGLLARCGARGGQSIAGLITRARNSVSAPKSGIVAHGQDIADATVLAALQSFALDAAQPDDARIASISVLLQVTLDGLFFAKPAEFNDANRYACSIGTLAYWRPEGTPLPVAAKVQVRAMAKQIRDATGTPTAVRTAARCLYQELNHALPAEIDTSQIRLTYICGNQFRIRNPQPRFLTLTYDVYGTSERNEVSAGDLMDSFFWTKNRGTVRLFYNGTLIQTKANGGKSCP